MNKDAFESRRVAFEEDYFQKKDAQLVDKLKAVFQKKQDKEEIQRATGVTDEVVLENLLALNLSGELMSAFKLLPLVEVAWADGQVDAREAKAVLEAVEELGIPKGSGPYAMLENSLKNHPRPDARKAWYGLAAELCKVLNPQELATFRQDLLEHTRRVAEVSGGILNIALTVSANERKVLDAVEKALTPAQS